MAGEQRLIPGLGFVTESVTSQALVPGAGFVNETTTAGGGATALTVQNLAHAQSLDSPLLTQHNVLAVDGLTQAQSLGQPALTQHNVLALDGLTQQQSLGQPTVLPPPSSFVMSLDGDNDVYDGQSAIILPTGGQSFGASGNKVEIKQGGTTVAQAVTAESASSITITVNLAGLTVPGSATLRVGRPT